RNADMTGTARRAGALLAAGILVVGLGACGDDGEDGESTAGGTAAEEGADADPAAFCDAAVEVDAASLGLESGETSPEQFDQSLQAAEDAAPEEISGDVTTMVDEARAMTAEA